MTLTRLTPCRACGAYPQVVASRKPGRAFTYMLLHLPRPKDGILAPCRFAAYSDSLDQLVRVWNNLNKEE